jgi:hypothetical protein
MDKKTNLEKKMQSGGVVIVKPKPKAQPKR